MPWPYTLNTIDPGAMMDDPSGQDAINPLAAALADLQAAIPSLTHQNFTARLVVDDADATNSWTPSGGPGVSVNPNLGSTGWIRGRYMQIGSFVHATIDMEAAGSGVSAGIGAYRFALPLPCTARANADQAVVGFGHMFDADAPNTIFGLGPGNFKHVGLHVASSVDVSVCGIVIGTNPTTINGATGPTWTITNASTDRAFNATAPTGTYSEAIAEETRNNLATLIGDIDGSRGAGAILDNVGAGIPFTLTAGDRIHVDLWYETE